jgi:4-diphosphocytidyl-2-C-methyl-D-erythritol kinase
MSASAFAPAKVNLYLHVGPPGADGYHPLDSLRVFADIGDEVSLASGPRPALSLTGPFGAGLEAGDNLVLQAARQLTRRLGRAEPPPALVLDKRLPVAAGLGGGSADAAATLRLLNIAWGGRLSAGDLEILAADLGSDVPACVRSRPVIATGRGEVLTPAPDLPALPAVLVNPGVACPTGAVYRAFDAAGRFGDLSPPPQPPTRDGVAGIARWLSGLRNDLEAPAASVAPVIAIVLERLQAAPETLLARLSGSGATCFALCPDAPSAARLAAILADEHPDWWVRPCRLGAPLPAFG